MYNNQYKATCYFIDVGQGTSQVIYLGEHRAIIVDTGRRRERNQSPLLTLLRDLDVQIIEALVPSHNDYDHIGDAKNVIDKYQRCIRKIYFVDDRSLDENYAYKTIAAAERSSCIERKQIIRLEAGEHNDIFNDGIIVLTVLYPDLLANLELARNATCAVIALTVGDQKIIFSGDVPVEAWRTIIAHNGKQSLQIMTVPHHGGNFAIDVNDREWFFENVTAQYAIVSVGYGNKYNHPKPEVIRSFVQHNTEIFCTQSNPACHFEIPDDNVTCCGTIVVDIGSNCTVIRDVVKLRKIKDQFPKRTCKNSIIQYD